MKRTAAAICLTMAVLCGVSCTDKSPESKPAGSSSALAERSVSANDLAAAIYNAHTVLSADAPDDPVFGKAVAVGKLEKGDIFGDRLLPDMPDAEGSEYIIIHRENGSLKQGFARFDGENDIGCRGECKDISGIGVSGWDELVEACEAAGGLPYEPETVTLTGDELCREPDRAIIPELTVTGDPANKVWLELAEPSPSMVGYMGSGYTFYADETPDSAVLTLTYDPELIFIADQSPENFQPAMYIFSESGDLREVAGQSAEGCAVSAEVKPGNTYILANKTDLEKFWNS